MNARGRLLIELLLLVAVIGIGLYAFNQYQVLTDTQTSLEEISQNGTALAEEAAANATQASSNLESAQSTASQSAAEANSTSTENSQIIANNYSTETRVAVVNATNEARIEATGTQSAENAAANSTQVAEENSTAQANLAATSTQAVNNANSRLANANATSTEAAGNANATSTAGRRNLSSANATSTEALANANARGTDAANDTGTEIASLSNDVAEVEAELAEVLDDLETADATIEAQQAEIEDLRETNTGSNTDGLVLVETNRFEIYLSEDYILLNFEEDYEDTLDELYDMGGEFESFAEILDNNEEVFTLGGVLNEDADDYAPEVMFIYPLEALFAISMEDYLDTSFANVVEGAELLDLGVIELGGQEVGRAIIEFEDDTDAHQVQYIVQEDRTYWHIVFGTLSNDFESRLEQFDASVATFRLR